MSKLGRRFFPLMLALTATSPSEAAQIPVTTLVDTDVADGACSLREAIQAANLDAVVRECPAGSGLDRITVDLEGTMLLGADLPAIDAPLEIVGPQTEQLTIDGQGSFRPFRLAAGADSLRLGRMTLLDGHANDSGGCVAVPDGADELELRRMRFVGCHSDGDGGAVDGFAIAWTEVSDSTFQENTAGDGGGALHLWNTGAARVEGSTFTGNQAGLSNVFGGAGAIGVSFVDLELVRSTVSGNSAAGSAGGISFSGFSIATIESSTITGNLAGTSGNSAVGGGVTLGGAQVEITFSNSVIAQNEDLVASGVNADDIYAGTTGGPAVVTSAGFNFIGSNQGATSPFPASPAAGLPNVNGDFVGSSSAAIDPLLGELAPNGGGTWTRRPRAGSPLVDQGNCATETVDQRGYANLDSGLRVVDDAAIANFGDGCDIGAVELGATSDEGLLHADNFESGSTVAWESAGF
jgi:CSLREA domain-containing protein